MSSRRVRIFQSTGSGVPADYCGSERDVPCDLLRAVPMLAPDEKNRDGRLSLPKQMDCRIYQRSTSHWLLCSAPEHEGDPNQQHSTPLSNPTFVPVPAGGHLIPLVLANTGSGIYVPIRFQLTQPPKTGPSTMWFLPNQTCHRSWHSRGDILSLEG